MPANQENKSLLFSMWPRIKISRKKRVEPTPEFSQMAFSRISPYESEDLDKSRKWVSIDIKYDGPYWENRHTKRLNDMHSTYFDENNIEHKINWQLHTKNIQLNDKINQITMIGVLEKV